MTDGIHEEERQSDVDGAGQRQQDTEDDTDRLRRSAQEAAGEEDPQQRQQEQYKLPMSSDISFDIFSELFSVFSGHGVF